MPVIRGCTAAIAAALLGLGSFGAYASQVTNSTDVIIELRLAGDAEALTPIGSCLADKLSQMPDVKVAAVPTDGVRFVVDIVAAKNASKKISASLVVAEIFPMEQFRPSDEGRRECGCSIDEHPVLHPASAARGRSGPIL